jgi:hypothetical protein
VNVLLDCSSVGLLDCSSSLVDSRVDCGIVASSILDLLSCSRVECFGCCIFGLVYGNIGMFFGSVDNLRERERER